MKKVLILFIVIVTGINNIYGKKEIATSSDYKALAESSMEKIIADSFGNLYTTYRIKYQGAYQNWVFTSFDNGASWLPLGNGPVYSFYTGYDQKYGTIGIDNQGKIYAVWIGIDKDNLGYYIEDGDIKYGEFQIKVATWWNGKWSEWKNISQVKGYNNWINTSVGSNYHYWQENPSIAFDSKNNAYIVWEGEDSIWKNSQIKFSKSIDGGKSWTPYVNLTHFSNTATNIFVQKRPIILIDNNDKIYVLWEAQDKNHVYSSTGDPYTHLRCIYSTNYGESWFPDNGEIITTDPSSQRYMSAYFDKEDNKIYLVWSGRDKINSPYKSAVKSQIRFGYYDGSWHVNPGYIAWIYGWEQKNPTITMDKNKSIHVLWEGNDDTYIYYDEGDPDTEDKKTGHFIFYSYKPAGGSWSTYKVLDKGLYPHYLKNAYNNKLSWVYLRPEGKDDFKLYFNSDSSIYLNKTLNPVSVKTNEFTIHFAPRPFNPYKNNAIIKYELSNRTHIKIGVINLSGIEVAVLSDGIKEKGIHTFFWNGGKGTFNASEREVIGGENKVSPGVYLLYIKSSDRIKYLKLLIYK